MATINNGESGLSVRNKLNTIINKVEGVAAIDNDINVSGNITVTGTVDGRDIAADGSKLDGIEAGADVTDTANVTSAGALMDSELTDIAAVKALDQGVATTDDPTFTGVDLAAIAASKAVTAVDVFVYDTSKDSDGGAWRKRTQHTSWYNETLNTATRGSRREFPAVAVIVAESNKVTIYDGDDPALPMWMVFNVVVSYTGGLITVGNDGTVTALAAVNGSITVSTNGTGANQGANGVFVISFPADRGIKYCQSQLSTYFDLDIARRNAVGGTGNDYLSGPDLGRLVNNNHNDVAMTVLPDASIDPATGLPVPVIAVATDGGVSVIKDDGTVVDITGQTTSVLFVSFNADDELITTGNFQDQYYVYTIPPTDILQNDATYRKRFYVFNTSPAVLSGTALDLIDGYKGSSAGLTVLAEDQATPANGMVAHVTSSYNSGYQNGSIKGAFLSDTDTASLVGAELFSASGQSGTITGSTTPWYSNENLGQFSIASDVLSFNNSSWEAVRRNILTVGQRYAVTFTVTMTSGSASVNVGGNTAYNYSSGTYTYFSEEASYNYIQVGANTGAVGTVEITSIKVADADRSVNSVGAINKGLIVNGTVTRSAVATGAELVAYSGFSASNYLEQPYNSALDFGTGDFCVMGWVSSATADRVVLDRADSSADFRYSLSENSSGYWQFYMKSGASTGSVISTSLASSARLDFVCVVRRAGTLEMWVNGRLEASAANTINITASSQTLVFGAKYDYTQPLNGSMALLRISATAPTAEQIKKIYEDEKVLFQENAAATLYGASDAVTALAHDSDTGLLHVGTSAGRSVFQGLRRVSNTTTAVGTAISAANNLIVEE